MPVAKALKADQCNTSCSFLSGPAMVTGFVGHAKKWDCDCKRVAQAYKKAHTVGLGLFLIWCRVPCNQNWQCHIKSSLKYLLWISIVFYKVGWWLQLAPLRLTSPQLFCCVEHLNSSARLIAFTFASAGIILPASECASVHWGPQDVNFLIIGCTRRLSRIGVKPKCTLNLKRGCVVRSHYPHFYSSVSLLLSWLHKVRQTKQLFFFFLQGCSHFDLIHSAHVRNTFS